MREFFNRFFLPDRSLIVLPEIEIADAAANVLSAMQIPRPANDNGPPIKPGGAAQMPVPLVA